MPIKDPQKAREYKRLWIADKRKQQKFNSVEPVEPKATILKELKKIFWPCSICTNMRKKYGSADRPDETWCLSCSLKKNNQAIVPLSLIHQICELIKKKKIFFK